MTLVTRNTSSLIGGVSQQPDAIRFKNQCDAQDNAYPSVLDGLTKRPPTEYVKNIFTPQAGTGAEDFFVHTINRDADSQYISVVETTAVAAFDPTLNIVDVLNPTTAITVVEGSDNALQYFDINPSSSLTTDTAIRAITIADYTFFVNRTKVVAMDVAVDTADAPQALFFVKQGDYGTTYTASITYNGIEYATSVTTPDGADATDRDDLATDVIAEVFKTGVVPSSGAGSGLTVTLTNLGLHTHADIDVDRSGSSVWVKEDASTELGFTSTASDGLGDTALILVKDEIQHLTDLPVVGPEGFRVLVVGDAIDERDDYYVKFVADNGVFGSGLWEESRESGVTYKIDPTTMPHVLIRISPTKFIFTACTHDGVSDGAGGTYDTYIPLWGERNVGDTTSNSDPSFIGKTVNDVFLFKNRLGLLSDENVILSETAEYFNFFRTTVTSLLDTAPIDIASSHSAVSILTSAIPFHKQLVLFSEGTQFILQGGQTLTPKTVSMTKTTNYDSISHTRPVSLGHSIYFGFDRGDFTGIRQYYITGDTETIFDASDISGQVPQYIKGSLRDMAGSSHEDILCVLSDFDRSVLSVYKFYDQGRERMQSAWGQFRFAAGDEIMGIEFIDTTLYIITKRADGIYLDKMTLESGLVDAGSTYRTLLDRRVGHADVTMSYSSSTALTTITLPYTVPASLGMEMISTDGLRIAIDSQASASADITVQGDHTASTFWIGESYEMVYRFSNVVVRSRTTNEPIVMGRVQVRYLTITFADTGFFKMEVTPDYRDTSTHVFTGHILGSGSFELGGVPLESGVYRVPVYSKANQVIIECKNDTPLPCAILNAEFELDVNNRHQQIRS